MGASGAGRARPPSAGRRLAHNRGVNSPLSSIPIAKRRTVTATLGLFAVLFGAVGAVAATGRDSAATAVYSGVSIVVAALLALMAWGVLHSIRIDSAEAELDHAIESAVAGGEGSALSCGCGHEHDADELHVTTDVGNTAPPERCAHDGTGVSCRHDCNSCELAALRHR